MIKMSKEKKLHEFITERYGVQKRLGTGKINHNSWTEFWVIKGKPVIFHVLNEEGTQWDVYIPISDSNSVRVIDKALDKFVGHTAKGGSNE